MCSFEPKGSAPDFRKRILTDTAIIQSATWTERTTHLASEYLPMHPLTDKSTRSFGKQLKILIDFLILLTSIPKYDVVVTSDPKIGQLFALYRKLFAVKRPKHVVIELMLDEEANSIRWKAKRIIQQFLYSSVNLICVSSSDEIKTYPSRLKLPHNRFKFVHFHTNVIEPKMLSFPKSYILSAGRTGRDFNTFVAAAESLPMKFVLIADPQSLNGVNPPNNVDLMVDVSREAYLKCVKECAFVVVPLHTLVKSTGQVVILEAMGYGKPVIATDAVGTRDYVKSRYNGILVPPKDPASLRKAINDLASDIPLQKTLSQNALNFVRQKCTFEIYAKNILNLIDNLE